MNLIGMLGLLSALITGLILLWVRRHKSIAIILIMAVIVFSSLQYLVEAHWLHGFEAVQDGATLEMVISMMGNPTIIAESTAPPFGYTLSYYDKRVTREAWYVSFFFPAQYVMGFDANGRLISRYQYVSP